MEKVETLLGGRRGIFDYVCVSCEWLLSERKIGSSGAVPATFVFKELANIHLLGTMENTLSGKTWSDLHKGGK